METTITPGKFAAKYGLYAGLIIVAFALMLFNMDAHADPDSPAQYVNMVILLACIILPILGYKKSQGGFISLGTCLKIGVVVGLIAAIIGAVYYFALTNFLDPELPAKMAELQQQKVLEQNPQMTQEQLDQMSEMSKKFAWVAYPAILIVNMLIGLIMGLIVGLFVKKSKPQDD